ncbi:MAG: GntR family transcriptional regulator [Polyangiaceae bacterium]|nr:GntR family transcriptional regulator [Polyangiaceae bacterium]
MKRATWSSPAAGEAGRDPARAALGEPTLASAVVDRLREGIVRGVLAPGEKLRLEHLAARYGVGRTPLREACCRLAAEGLVTIEDQRGFRVTPVSRADLLDLTRTRQHLETLALRASLLQGDVAWEGEVAAALHRLLRAERGGAGGAALDDAWEREHAALHRVLLSACGSAHLLRFHGMLFDQSERYRRLAQAYGQPERDVDGEHRALVKAALERDAERACALLTEHIARTTDRVLECHPALAAEAPTPARARRPSAVE